MNELLYHLHIHSFNLKEKKFKSLKEISQNLDEGSKNSENQK